MRYLSTLFICVLALQETSVLRGASMPDAPFPSPHFTVEQATQKVQAFFSEVSKLDKEWMIISVRFGNPDAVCPKEGGYLDVDRHAWSWFITCANPRSGASMFYQLTEDGKVHSIGQIQT